MADGETVAEVLIHRARVWLVIVAVWCVLVVAGLTRGLLLSNDRRLFGLGLMVAVVGTAVTVRILWRLPHTLLWTAERSLVLRSLGGQRVLALEPPVEIRLYQTTVETMDHKADVTYLVIASHSDSVGVAFSGRRAMNNRRFEAAVAEGTGAERPRPEVLSFPERRWLRRDPTLRWLNAGGDFTLGQFYALWAAALLLLPSTILAGIGGFAPPPPVTRRLDSADDVRRSLEATHEAFVTDLRGSRWVKEPLAAPTVDVVASRCEREDWLLWGPADESWLDTTAVVTLRDDAVDVVEKRLSFAAEQDTWDDASWTYQSPDPVLLTTQPLWFSLDGHDLSVTFSTDCLTDESQRAIRPAVEDHALRVLETVAGPS